MLSGLDKSRARRRIPEQEAPETDEIASAHAGALEDNGAPGLKGSRAGITGSSRERLRIKKVLSSVARSGAGKGDPVQQVPLRGDAGSERARLRGKNVNPKHVNPRAKIVEPVAKKSGTRVDESGLQRLLNNKVGPKIRWSGGEAAKSAHARLRSSSEKPGMEMSGANRESSRRTFAETEENEPKHAGDLSKGSKPRCKRSKTSEDGPNLEHWKTGVEGPR